MAEGERLSVQDEAIAATSEAIADVLAQEELPESVTFSNGLKLRLRHVSQVLIAQVTGRIADPAPPMADIGKGRLEPNESDPDFLDELERRKNVRAQVAGNALIVFGTGIEVLPPGLLGPEDLAWIDEVEALNDLGVDLELETPLGFPKANPSQRYLSWLSYYALPKGEDLEELARLLLRIGGITEAEVVAAMATFPGGAQRGAANGGKAKAASADRPNRRQRRARPDPAP